MAVLAARVRSARGAQRRPSEEHRVERCADRRRGRDGRLRALAGRCQRADARCCTSDESTAVIAGLFDVRETAGEGRPILERLEMRFAVRVIVGDLRPRAALRYAEIGEEVGKILRRHGAAAVGVHREL